MFSKEKSDVCQVGFLLPDTLFWLEASVLASTVVWDSGDRPVLVAGGISVFLSRNEN